MCPASHCRTYNRWSDVRFAFAVSACGGTASTSIWVGFSIVVDQPLGGVRVSVWRSVYGLEAVGGNGRIRWAYVWVCVGVGDGVGVAGGVEAGEALGGDGVGGTGGIGIICTSAGCIGSES